jgi:AcrR family transcriptional regulator
MGQTSSALYRYFPSRDELLTALIVDAYDDLGASVEKAEARVARGDILVRWRTSARAIRRWAKQHPHEYALIFGTPVPGYQAPELTIEAATRVTTVLATIIADRYREHPTPRRATLNRDRSLLWDNVVVVMPGVPDEVARRAILVWAQLYGFVSFELFGHFVGSVDSTDALFEVFVAESANALGLDSVRPDRSR